MGRRGRTKDEGEDEVTMRHGQTKGGSDANDDDENDERTLGCNHT